jgi:hypothetical protein
VKNQLQDNVMDTMGAEDIHHTAHQSLFEPNLEPKNQAMDTAIPHALRPLA